MPNLENERHISPEPVSQFPLPSLKKDSHLHEPILRSKLETDAYKFSMGNVFLKEIPYEARYSFVNRNNLTFPEHFGELLKEQVDQVLSTLSDRERRVLEERFGLKDGRPKTLEEVGKMFAVTRERIRQIEAKSLRKLRHPSRGNKLKDYLG